MSGTGFNFTDLYVHGMLSYGIVTGQMGDATFTRVWVIGNGYGGFIVGNTGSTTVTGTLTFNQPIVEWNGCQEAYPMINSGVDNNLNYSQCWGQNSGGFYGLSCWSGSLLFPTISPFKETGSVQPWKSYRHV